MNADFMATEVLLLSFNETFKMLRKTERPWHSSLHFSSCPMGYNCLRGEGKKEPSFSCFWLSLLFIIIDLKGKESVISRLSA